MAFASVTGNEKGTYSTMPFRRDRTRPGRRASAAAARPPATGIRGRSDSGGDARAARGAGLPGDDDRGDRRSRRGRQEHDLPALGLEGGADRRRGSTSSRPISTCSRPPATSARACSSGSATSFVSSPTRSSAASCLSFWRASAQPDLRAGLRRAGRASASPRTRRSPDGGARTRRATVPTSTSSTSPTSWAAAVPAPAPTWPPARRRSLRRGAARADLGRNRAVGIRNVQSRYDRHETHPLQRRHDERQT